MLYLILRLFYKNKMLQELKSFLPKKYECHPVKYFSEFCNNASFVPQYLENKSFLYMFIKKISFKYINALYKPIIIPHN